MVPPIHAPPDDYGIKTIDLLLGWKTNILQDNNEFITSEEAIVITKDIDRIEIYPSKSSNWKLEQVIHAFAVIYKK